MQQNIKKNLYQKTLAPLFTVQGKKIEDKRFDKEPIVIGACPRSGTTLLLAILGAHENIFAIPKQTYAFEKWTSQANGGVKPTRMDRLYREFLRNRIDKNARRWCEKTPKNLLSFDKILSYYNGEIKLIHMVRDGRDVVTSQHPQHNPGEYWVSTDKWVQDVSFGLEFADHPSVYTLRYEDLIQNFQETMGSLSEFLQIEYTQHLHTWKEHTPIRKSKHWGHRVKEIHNQALHRWQKQEHQQRMEAFMANSEAVSLLQKLDYTV